MVFDTVRMWYVWVKYTTVPHTFIEVLKKNTLFFFSKLISTNYRRATSLTSTSTTWKHNWFEELCITNFYQHLQSQLVGDADSNVSLCFLEKIDFHPLIKWNLRPPVIKQSQKLSRLGWVHILLRYACLKKTVTFRDVMKISTPQRWPNWPANQSPLF